MAAKKKVTHKKKTTSRPKTRVVYKKMGTTTRRKKRSVGGVDNKAIEMIGLGVIGGVAARVLYKNASGIGIPQNMAPFAAPAIGAGLAFFVKNPIVKAVGAGMLIVGATNAIPDADLPLLTKNANATASNSGNTTLPPTTDPNNTSTGPALIGRMIPQTVGKMPQTIGRNNQRKMIKGVNDNYGGNAANKTTKVPMTIGSLYGGVI